MKYQIPTAFKKVCHGCGKEIKQKPAIINDYYYCNKPNIPCRQLTPNTLQ